MHVTGTLISLMLHLETVKSVQSVRNQIGSKHPASKMLDTTLVWQMLVIGTLKFSRMVNVRIATHVMSQIITIMYVSRFLATTNVCSKPVTGKLKFLTQRVLARLVQFAKKQITQRPLVKM